jgi:LysR family transcriptional regulator, regulator for bpeEF and oprC
MQTPVNLEVQRHLKAGRLVQVLPEWTAAELPLVILYPRNRHLSAKVRAFADWAVSLYERSRERAQ